MSYKIGDEVEASHGGFFIRGEITAIETHSTTLKTASFISMDLWSWKAPTEDKWNEVEHIDGRPRRILLHEACIIKKVSQD
jgi:hypothetical protein